jgi:acylphosphatase
MIGLTENTPMLVRATLIVNGTDRMARCREHLHRQAEQLGLTGLFEDLGDGRINIVVEGEKERVNEFISSFNEGKCIYHFSGFDIEFKNPEGRFGSFTVAGT